MHEVSHVSAVPSLLGLRLANGCDAPQAVHTQMPFFLTTAENLVIVNV